MCIERGELFNDVNLDLINSLGKVTMWEINMDIVLSISFSNSE